MSEETTPPIRLSETTRIRLPLVMLVSLISVVAYAAIVWSGDHNAVADHATILTIHADRLKKLEESQTAIAVMQRDVEWIRKQLEAERRRQP